MGALSLVTNLARLKKGEQFEPYTMSYSCPCVYHIFPGHGNEMDHEGNMTVLDKFLLGLGAGLDIEDAYHLGGRGC